jgi:hypothetical protein
MLFEISMLRLRLLLRTRVPIKTPDARRFVPTSLPALAA